MPSVRVVLFITLTLPAAATIAQDSTGGPSCGTFEFGFDVTVPGNPEGVFDALTGDISPWWDHSFSKKPYRLYIEPKPGGGFYELFNDRGDGVLHATVIVADRGRMLRFEGPLGLSGQAILLVCTYTLERKGDDSTTISLSVHAAGEVKDGQPGIVRSVWNHFLVERFKPYMEGRARNVRH